MQSESENELENGLSNAGIVSSMSIRRFSLETEFNSSSENDWIHGCIYDNEDSQIFYDPRNWSSEPQLHAELTSERNFSISSDETHIENGVNNQLVDLSTVGWGSDEDIPVRSANAVMFEESVNVAENIIGEDIFMIVVPPGGITINLDDQNEWMITSFGEFVIQLPPGDEYGIIQDENERLIGEEILLDEPIWWRPWE